MITFSNPRSYDPLDRLTNRWSAAKSNTVYRYDPVGNLTNVDYAVSTDITLKYDWLNRLTNMVDAAGTTRYSYDPAGQVLSEDGPWSEDTVSYTYQNRLRGSLSVSAPNASAWAQSYTHDSIRRLAGVTSPAGAFSYDYGVWFDIYHQPVSLPGSLVYKLTLPNADNALSATSVVSSWTDAGATTQSQRFYLIVQVQ